MTKPTAQRKQVWIDRHLQGIVIRRVLLYWLMCFSFLTIPILIGKTLADPSRYFFQHLPSVAFEFWPMYLGLVLLLPVIAYDALVLSHRVAGPVFRIRRELTKLAAGETSREVQLREKDFFQELVEPVNEIRNVLYHGHVERQELDGDTDAHCNDNKPSTTSA